MEAEDRMRGPQTERDGDRVRGPGDAGARGAVVTRRRFLGCVAAAAATGCDRSVGVALRQGNRPQSITLEALAGGRVALPEAYRGRVVLVNFWTSWCPSCREELEAMEAIFAGLRPRGVQPVSVNVGESAAAVAEFLRSRPVTYPILLDSESAAARLYGVIGLPVTFILDRGGGLASKILGEIHRDGLRRILEGMLAP
jgi:cytochrome c biogenesis protein CcmG, thiol:disulfide interchange protein DsbE